MKNSPPIGPWDRFTLEEKMLDHADKFDRLNGRIHRITWCGNLFKWRIMQREFTMPPTKSKGSTTGFSPAARKRMLEKVSMVNYSKIKPAYFITLTYPDHLIPVGKTDANKQRYLFWRDMEKYLCGQASGLWRLEWIGRKTGEWVGYACPHFHLLLFNGRFLDVETVRASWMRAIRADDWVSVDCQMMVSEKQVGIYVAKYSAKIPGSLDIGLNLNKIWSGKQWGIHRRNRVPWHEAFEMNLVTSDFLDGLYAYAVEGLQGDWATQNISFTVLGEKSRELAELIQFWAIDAQLKAL